ncbi:MAG: hypothetical protein IJC48_11095 [Clostridia bacterium]|nr:hypothetical protein [Clostridia bacterium]MBQ4157176.1 hypothetical protein [Clostridia bacterium]
MKRFLSCVLALMLALSMLTFGAMGEGETVWYLIKVVTGGMEFPTAEMGLEMSYTLYPDGTGTLWGSIVGSETSEPCTWTKQGDEITITDAASFSVTGVLADGYLRINDEEMGGELVFSNEKEAVSYAYTPAAARANVAMEEFDGEWNAFLFEMEGMQFTMADIGSSMKIVFKDGKGEITASEYRNDKTYSVIGEIIEVEANGDEPAYTVLNLIDINAPDEIGLQFMMLEDGIMVYDFEGACCYFEKQIMH